MAEKYIYIYDRTAGTLPLAEAEAEYLTAGKVISLGVVEGTKSLAWGWAGYLRGGGRLLAKGETLEQLCCNVKKVAVSSPAFKIIAEPIPRTIGGDFRAIVQVASVIEGRVDLQNPKDKYLLIITDNKYWLVESGSSGDREWLKYKHKPHPFCNALPIKMARAILALSCSQGDTVLDPCCGSGTIPMLASNMGMRALGSDLSWHSVNRSRKNLAHFNCKAKILHEDATCTKRYADCIIANLPYDLYCPVLADTIIKMLANFRTIASKVVLISSMNLEEQIANENYTVQRIIKIKRDRFVRNIYFLHC